MTARSTWGSLRLVSMFSVDSRAWPTKKATNDVTRPATRVTPVSTRTLLTITRVRRGTATRVERMPPVEYSDVMSMTPSTATASWPNVSPARLTPAGSKVALSTASTSDHVDAVPQQTRAENPTVTANRAESVQNVERTVRSFVHSERMTSTTDAWRSLTRPLRRSAAAGEAAAGPVGAAAAGWR